MAVEVNISKENADYYVEAYTKDYKINEGKTVEQIGVTRLAYVAGYRDYDLGDEEQIATWLDLRNKLKEAYETYPDGEVTVKLVIKDDWVNV
jgi:hypothetical protein|tara:strand:- start:431 stop:706 length:276 start_codon:yes stop_codon:yes gene_type:complete